MRPATAGASQSAAHALQPAPTLVTSVPGNLDRPTTAGSVRSATSLLKQKRDQQMLVAMLHSTIADTYKRPPDGVSHEEIARHRAELEAMLEAVTQERHSTNNEAARLQAERWAEAHRAQLAKEERIAQQGQQKEKRSQAQMEENRRELAEKFEKQQKDRYSHTAGAFKHLDDVLAQRMQTLKEALDKKEQKHNALLSARSQWQEDQRRRQAEAERHAEELLQRRRRLEEQRHKELEEQANAHRKAAEEKATRSKDILRERLRQRKLHQGRAHEKGQVDYEALRKAEAAAQERRDRNVQEAIEMRNAQRKAVETKFGTLKEKQLTNRDHVVEERLAKQAELLAFERARFKDIDAAVETQARQLEIEGRIHDQKILEHQQRSREVYTAKLNTMSNKIFNRWRSKAAVIADHIAMAAGVDTPGRLRQPSPESTNTPQPPPSPSARLSRVGSAVRPITAVGSMRLVDQFHQH